MNFASDCWLYLTSWWLLCFLVWVSAREQFSETTIGYRDLESASLLQQLFDTPYFRVNLMRDVPGMIYNLLRKLCKYNVCINIPRIIWIINFLLQIICGFNLLFFCVVLICCFSASFSQVSKFVVPWKISWLWLLALLTALVHFTQSNAKIGLASLSFIFYQ